MVVFEGCSKKPCQGKKTDHIETFLVATNDYMAARSAFALNRPDPNKVTAHYLGDALAAVAAGHVPKTRETKSLGCRIKSHPR